MHCLGKLHRMHVTVNHLQSTGIGRTVNTLRKDDGEVGALAKTLIAKWKEMVANEASDGSEEDKTHEYPNEHDEDANGDDDESDKVQIDPSHRNHEQLSKNSGNQNHHHQNHHNHNHHHHREHHLEKSNDDHSHQRKVWIASQDVIHIDIFFSCLNVFIIYSCSFIVFVG